jgi:hypothetical protein
MMKVVNTHQSTGQTAPLSRSRLPPPDAQSVARRSSERELVRFSAVGEGRYSANARSSGSQTNVIAFFPLFSDTANRPQAQRPAFENRHGGNESGQGSRSHLTGTKDGGLYRTASVPSEPTHSTSVGNARWQGLSTAYQRGAPEVLPQYSTPHFFLVGG